jgi:hypothetical protein
MAYCEPNNKRGSPHLHHQPSSNVVQSRNIQTSINIGAAIRAVKTRVWLIVMLYSQNYSSSVDPFELVDRFNYYVECHQYNASKNQVAHIRCCDLLSSPRRAAAQWMLDMLRKTNADQDVHSFHIKIYISEQTINAIWRCVVDKY